MHLIGSLYLTMMRRAIHLVRIDADKLANRAEAEKVKGRR